MHVLLIDKLSHGGDLGGTGGRSPKKCMWGRDGPCNRSPNISRSSVIGCVRKYKLGKRKVSLRIFFLVKKGPDMFRPISHLRQLIQAKPENLRSITRKK